jgi:hypothetical protein
MMGPPGEKPGGKSGAVKYPPQPKLAQPCWETQSKPEAPKQPTLFVRQA